MFGQQDIGVDIVEKIKREEIGVPRVGVVGFDRKRLAIRGSRCGTVAKLLLEVGPCDQHGDIARIAAERRVDHALRIVRLALLDQESREHGGCHRMRRLERQRSFEGFDRLARLFGFERAAESEPRFEHRA